MPTNSTWTALRTTQGATTTAATASITAARPATARQGSSRHQMAIGTAARSGPSPRVSATRPTANPSATAVKRCSVGSATTSAKNATTHERIQRLGQDALGHEDLSRHDREEDAGDQGRGPPEGSQDDVEEQRHGGGAQEGVEDLGDGGVRPEDPIEQREQEREGRRPARRRLAAEADEAESLRQRLRGRVVEEHVVEGQLAAAGLRRAGDRQHEAQPQRQAQEEQTRGPAQVGAGPEPAHATLPGGAPAAPSAGIAPGSGSPASPGTGRRAGISRLSRSSGRSNPQ